MPGRRGLVVVLSLLLLTSLAPPSVAADRSPWVAAWAASPVAGSVIPWSDCPAGTGLRDQTVRNVVFVSAGGPLVRVRFTNAFGATPLRIGHASVAVQATGAAAVAGSMRELTFHGRRSVTVPAGRELFSDPVRLRVAALSTLLVSAHVPGPTGPVTNHPFTAQGNFLAAGDHATAATGAAYGGTPCWMLADGVDVRPDRRVVGSVVALGDSITDTSATTGNANHRWPDFLARRLNAVPGPTLSVVNAGLGGNRVLAPRDGEPFYGVTAPELIAGLEEIADRSRAAGLRVIGGTITPFGGSFLETPARVATWAAVNDWIRTTDAFDGVVDFAAATAAPGDPGTLLPAYDSGDHLHPNDAGTEAMANAVDLSLLVPARQLAAS